MSKLVRIENEYELNSVGNDVKKLILLGDEYDYKTPCRLRSS